MPQMGSRLFAPAPPQLLADTVGPESGELKASGDAQVCAKQSDEETTNHNAINNNKRIVAILFN